MKQRMLTNEALGSVCMAMAHLIHSGIGAGDALVLLQADEPDPYFRDVLGAMADGTDCGKPLAGVFREAGCFPAYVCTLMEVGERVGRLEDTLDALALYYQNRARLEEHLRSALLYPAVLLVVLLTVITVLLVWVLPVFDQVYGQLGGGLTGMAAGLLTLGMVVKQGLPVLLAVFLLLLAPMAVPSVRLAVAGFWKKHWGHRGVSGRINRARFIQALSLGLSSGMTAQEAVEMAAALAEAPKFRERCSRCGERIQQGASLPQALREMGLLNRAHCRLLEAGARSGRSEMVLQNLSRQLLEESEEALEREAAKAEPAVVVAACVLIGMVLFSVMLPLVNIMSTIG